MATLILHPGETLDDLIIGDYYGKDAISLSEIDVILQTNGRNTEVVKGPFVKDQ